MLKFYVGVTLKELSRFGDGIRTAKRVTCVANYVSYLWMFAVMFRRHLNSFSESLCSPFRKSVVFVTISADKLIWLKYCSKTSVCLSFS